MQIVAFLSVRPADQNYIELQYIDIFRYTFETNEEGKLRARFEEEIKRLREQLGGDGVMMGEDGLPADVVVETEVQEKVVEKKVVKEVVVEVQQGRYA